MARGHSLKLNEDRTKGRRHSFTQSRVVRVWNGSPSHAVDAESLGSVRPDPTKF